MKIGQLSLDLPGIALPLRTMDVSSADRVAAPLSAHRSVGASETAVWPSHLEGLTSRAATEVAALTEQLGDEEAAVAWMQTLLLVEHAHARRLITAGSTGGPVAAIEELAGAHPALNALADPRYNPAAAVRLPGRAERRLVRFWAGEPAVRELAVRRDDDTRPLGEFYQGLSAVARRARALCQTPAFVSDLLLTCTWDNALADWIWEPSADERLPVRAIDPSCGTGHILVDLFERALIASALHDQDAAVRNPWSVAESALACVHGVDIDPFAVAIARYRLLAAACARLGSVSLDQAPVDLPIRVACGDALLHPDSVGATLPPAAADGFTDMADFPEMLRSGRYHVVVGNPPYVTCKDAAAREAIRRSYRQVCSGKFSLAVPFEVLMHRLAAPGGWVGRLTANSFMKREFGKPLIERFFPTIDLRWIIDTSGAYIPGHGTPTVILISRNQPPSSDTVQVVRGNRGEPRAPADPAHGLVWSAIRDAVYRREQRWRLARSVASLTHGKL